MLANFDRILYEQVDGQPLSQVFNMIKRENINYLVEEKEKLTRYISRFGLTIETMSEFSDLLNIDFEFSKEMLKPIIYYGINDYIPGDEYGNWYKNISKKHQRRIFSSEIHSYAFPLAQKLLYIEYIINLFNDKSLLMAIDYKPNDDRFDKTIYVIYVYDNHIDVDFKSSEPHWYYKNYLDICYVSPATFKFKNISLCEIMTIYLLTFDQYIKYFLEKFIYGNVISDQDRIFYLVDYCPLIATETIRHGPVIDGENIYLKILMAEAKYHDYLHFLLNDWIENNQTQNFSKQAYYLMAELINEKEILEKEDKIIILKLFQLADDYSDAKRLLKLKFFAFLDISLGDIPDLELGDDIERMYRMAEFLRNYRR